MVWFWDHYVPNGRTAPSRTPRRCGPMPGGLAPAVVITAEHDVLRDEGEAYAERLQEAGVPTEHRRWAGQMHGFFTMVTCCPRRAEAMDFVAEAVARRA